MRLRPFDPALLQLGLATGGVRILALLHDVPMVVAELLPLVDLRCQALDLLAPDRIDEGVFIQNLNRGHGRFLEAAC